MRITAKDSHGILKVPPPKIIYDSRFKELEADEFGNAKCQMCAHQWKVFEVGLSNCPVCKTHCIVKFSQNRCRAIEMQKILKCPYCGRVHFCAIPGLLYCEACKRPFLIVSHHFNSDLIYKQAFSTYTAFEEGGMYEEAI